MLCLSAVLVWECNRGHLSYQCRYRLNQHLIVLSLCNVSINKILITEFITVKVSQNFIFDANTMKWNQQLSRYVFSKVSNVWNKTFENKSIAKDHRIPNKWTDYKIFELKHGHIKLLGNIKHNQVKLLIAIFFSLFVPIQH